jgi:hypothetical protein
MQHGISVKYWVRFEVLTATSMKTAVFWGVAQCSLVDIDRRFRRSYCLHQGDDGVSSSETSVSIYTVLIPQDRTPWYYMWHPIVNKLYPLNCWHKPLMYVRACPHVTSIPISIETCIIVCWFSVTPVPSDFLYSHKFNLYFDNSLAAVFKEPDLQTPHFPSSKSRVHFPFLRSIHGEGLLAPRLNRFIWLMIGTMDGSYEHRNEHSDSWPVEGLSASEEDLCTMCLLILSNNNKGNNKNFFNICSSTEKLMLFLFIGIIKKFVYKLRCSGDSFYKSVVWLFVVFCFYNPAEKLNSKYGKFYWCFKQNIIWEDFRFSRRRVRRWLKFSTRLHGVTSQKTDIFKILLPLSEAANPLAGKFDTRTSWVLSKKSKIKWYTDRTKYRLLQPS